MDYKAKLISLINDETLPIEQRKKLEEIYNSCIGSEDERIRKWIIDDIRYNMNNEPLNNSEYKKKAEKAIAWLEKQGEQKPAWSDEDKHRLEDTIYFLDTAKKHYASTVELDSCIAWLKSLKPQKQWKPTKEQMDALLFVVQHYTPNVSDKLAWDSLKILELMYYETKQ